MGRAPCCDKANVKRGPWSPEEDTALRNYLEKHGTGGNWIALPQKAGLKRCGKSCRLRWLNYLRPDIKHGGFTEEEDNVIYTLYQKIGSRWSVIASHLQGRTDNDVKNYWNTKLKKKLLAPSSTNKTTHKQIQLSDKIENNGTCVSNPSWIESQRLRSNSIQYPLPGLTARSEFGMNVNGYGVASSFSSSSVTVDNGYNSWSGSGYGESDGSLMDMLNGSVYDLLNEYDSQEKTGEIGPNSVNFSYTSLLATAETKPNGMYQSLTY